MSKDYTKERICHHHYRVRKEEMSKKKKPEKLWKLDMRGLGPYFSTMFLDDVRIAVRLETYKIDCTGNMKARYVGKDYCTTCDNKVVES